jgi:hypothetical protein
MLDFFDMGRRLLRILDMSKQSFIILFFLTLIIIPNYAYCVTSSSGGYIDNPHDDTKSHRIKSHMHSDTSVTNIIIDKIENGTIYSKDGQVFAITDSTQIINNHNPESNVQIGELFFKNGKITTVIIK